MSGSEKRNIIFSLSPLLYLFVFVITFRLCFDIDPLHGPHQTSLFLAGLLALIQRNGKIHSKSALILALKRNFFSVYPAMLILCLVGMLIGAWANAGVLGSMIDLGIRMLSPDFFLPGIAILCGISAVVSGSSWTTAGTLGLALMGVGNLLGFPPEVTAGAIVSGCYFGDKLSPLSDTTILASSLTEVPLPTHIRYMVKTTLPSFLVSLLLYSVWNFFHLPSETPLNTLSDSLFLSSSLHFEYWNLLPVVLVFGFSMFGVRAYISLGIGILSSCFFSFQRGAQPIDIVSSLVFGFHSSSGDPNLDVLLSGGGFLAIFPTECLILTAVWFGGILEGMGYLSELLISLKQWIHVKWDVLLATMGSSFLLNLTTADQYLSLVVPARAFRNLAHEYEIEGKEVSRALEDSGTISSPLIPWNSCGAFMATSLKISTIAYLPYVWFNLIHIFFAIALILFRRTKKN